MTLGNLAALKQSQGNLAEAGQLYRRALEIRERALGTAHPSVAVTLHNMAILAREQGRRDDEKALHLRALAILEPALGPDHPQVKACRAS